MKTHFLKCWRGPFQAILDGTKHHEVRVNDRGYCVGDELLLEEWDPGGAAGIGVGCYTSRKLHVRVTYISEGGTWGLPANLCVMSIEALAAKAPKERT